MAKKPSQPKCPRCGHTELDEKNKGACFGCQKCMYVAAKKFFMGTDPGEATLDDPEAEAKTEAPLKDPESKEDSQTGQAGGVPNGASPQKPAA